MVESRAGGCVVVVPRFDAMGAVVAVSSGRVRDIDDMTGLVSDIADRVGPMLAARSASARWEATRPIQAEVERQLASFTNVTVETTSDLHGFAGFEIDAIRIVSEDVSGEVCVVVAESGAWVVADGLDGPARPHDMVHRIVEDLVSELQSRMSLTQTL